MVNIKPGKNFTNMTVLLFKRSGLILSLLILFSPIINAESKCPDSATDPVAYIIDSRGKFCNDDTYIIKATGLQDNKANVIDEKKSRARRNAILEAQYKLLEVFIGDRIESWSPMYEPPEEYVRGHALWKKDIIALVKSGTILAESYDSALNCTILYSIQKKNLKQIKDMPFEEYTGDEK